MDNEQVFDRVTLHCVKQGNQRRFFTTQKQARSYARERYDYEDEGIPFIYSLHLHTPQHICDELNQRSDGDSVRRDALQEEVT